MDKVWRFDFGSAVETPGGFIKISGDSIYTESTGFGFINTTFVTSKDRGEGGELRRDFCIPVDTTFRVDVPNGTYTATVLMGDAHLPTCTTIRTGKGHMVCRDRKTLSGLFAQEMFSVYVRDGVFQLAFSGAAPRINSLELTAAGQRLTVFLAGDSTVTDEEESNYPYAGWGQLLSMYFKFDVAIANHARSGRSSKSFIDEGRLAAIDADLKADDYLFIQFGHNDEKTDEERRTNPADSYPAYLRRYIDTARMKNAHPVLITSVHRRFFEKDGRLQDTHGEYLEAVRRLADEERVPLIDLAKLSRELFERLGEEETKNVFMWGAPGEFINFPAGVQDNTHFQERGAMLLAKLVAEEIRSLNIWPLSMYLKL
jgi:lysophospholipase L1-like esterase